MFEFDLSTVCDYSGVKIWVPLLIHARQSPAVTTCEQERVMPFSMRLTANLGSVSFWTRGI